ncbi:OmpA family protein [Vibrio hippocampi]|uniref:Peptidoglycan-associated lipoprotein n=1 Tax=Vibrio hippocampi TaxID=654686 RepID=A0ABN8DKW1_9VIBR|nr:OmpA family protein [Vibrio hippocampi]CAH0529956.1 Peptidoglycan-associated lipoprotein [Vibrio hippocampi]
MEITSNVQTGIIALALLLSAGCSTSYPDNGTGGVGEYYIGADFSPVMPDEPLGPEHGLRFDWKLSKLHLDSLINEGARWCFPAAVLQAETKQKRIARELEANLWIDAANDIVIQRKQLNALELKLNYVLSQTQCVPPRSADEMQNLMQVVKELHELLNIDNQFAIDSVEINPKYMGHLAQAANLLKQYPSIKLSVTGHADITGTSEYNDKLAKGRAEQVKRYLMIFGLSPERMTTQSLGADLPLYPGDSAGVKLTNRRVSIDVLADTETLYSQGETP